MTNKRSRAFRLYASMLLVFALAWTRPLFASESAEEQLPLLEYQHGKCSRPIVMAHSGDYAPYQYQGRIGELIGLDVDLGKLFAGVMNCQLSLILLPPKRAQKMLAEGRIDMMAAASVTEARKKFSRFSLPYRAETSVMFTRKESAPFMASMSLLELVRSGMSFTTGLGGWYGEPWEDIKPYLNEGQLSLTNSTLGQINMVLMSRADVAVVDRYVGFYHAKTLGRANGLAEHPQILSDDPAHFMLSKISVSEGFLKYFNDAIRAKKTSSDYSDILKKYLPE